MLRACLPALCLIAAAPALAQDDTPALPTGPLVNAGYSADLAFFIQKPAAVSAKEARVTVWAIRREPRQTATGAFDMFVSHEIIDCEANTRRQVLNDVFLGDTHLTRSAGNGAASAIPAGTAVETYAGIVCGKTAPPAETFADLAAARANTKAHFAQLQ